MAKSVTKKASGASAASGDAGPKGVSKDPVGKSAVASKVPPKRPRSSYFIWLAENRERLTAEIAAKKGVGRPTTVLKLAGKEWKAIEDKSKWIKLAAEEKQRFEADMSRF